MNQQLFFSKAVADKFFYLYGVKTHGGRHIVHIFLNSWFQYYANEELIISLSYLSGLIIVYGRIKNSFGVPMSEVLPSPLYDRANKPPKLKCFTLESKEIHLICSSFVYNKKRSKNKIYFIKIQNGHWRTPQSFSNFCLVASCTC